MVGRGREEQKKELYLWEYSGYKKYLGAPLGYRLNLRLTFETWEGLNTLHWSAHDVLPAGWSAPQKRVFTIPWLIEILHFKHLLRIHYKNKRKTFKSKSSLCFYHFMFTFICGLLVLDNLTYNFFLFCLFHLANILICNSDLTIIIYKDYS